MKEIEFNNDEPSLTEKVNKVYDLLMKDGGINKKVLKIPRKAKISKSKKKKGWCGILFLNENKNIQGQRVKLDGGTYQTKDSNYHVTNGSELMFWEGKYPVFFQRYDKLNPTNLFRKEGEKNEIYGQDLVMLRMKKDLIKEKTKGGMGILMIIGILVAGYFLVKMLFPQLLGG